MNGIPLQECAIATKKLDKEMELKIKDFRFFLTDYAKDFSTAILMRALSALSPWKISESDSGFLMDFVRDFFCVNFFLSHFLWQFGFQHDLIAIIVFDF